MGELTSLRVGTVEQTLFAPMGDDLRINWGYAYAAAPTAQSKSAIGASKALLTAVRRSRHSARPRRHPHAPGGPRRRARDGLRLRPGQVAAAPVRRHVMVAYDEIYSIKYFGNKLRPYWRRNGDRPARMLQAAARDYPQLVARCEAFDEELMADLTKVGGDRYAQITALAYRQCLAAHGPGRRRQQAAAVVHQGEHQQRRHRHGGRVLPHGPDLDPAQPHAGQGLAGAGADVRRFAATGSFPTRRTTWAPIRSSSAGTTAARACPSRRAATC